MMLENFILLLLEAFAGTGIFAVIIFVTWLFFPEKIEKWVVLVHKFAAFISEKHERRYIAKHIELSINEEKGKLSKESSGILPYGIKIVWIDADNIESYLGGDDVLIVKMKNHRNQSKNLALAVREYVPNALIPKARRYVNPPLMKAIDYVISKSILSKDTNAFSYFVDIISPELESTPSAKDLVKELDKINEQGLLTRVLLSEYKKLGLLHPADPTPEVHTETLNFEKKVYALVTKKPEEKVSPCLCGNFIKAAVVPIAKDLTVEMYGLDPHMNFIKDSLQKGVETFYIIAAGKHNLLLAKTILERAIKEYRLLRIYESEYTATFRNQKMKMFMGILQAD